MTEQTSSGTSANLIGTVAARALPMAASRSVAAEPPRAGTRAPGLHNTCQCHKGPDGYGREGWHMRRFGERDVEREVEVALRGVPSDLEAFERRRIASNARAAATRYFGLPVAFERCPAYEKAVQRESEARASRRGGDTEGFLEGL